MGHFRSGYFRLDMLEDCSFCGTENVLGVDGNYHRLFVFSGDECSQEETTVLRTNDTAARQDCASYNTKLLLYVLFGALCVYVYLLNCT